MYEALSGQLHNARHLAPFSVATDVLALLSCPVKMIPANLTFLTDRHPDLMTQPPATSEAVAVEQRPPQTGMQLIEASLPTFLLCSTHSHRVWRLPSRNLIRERKLIC